jgi:hypothetical protein
MSLHALANDMASKGRYGDSMLVHMAPNEVAGLHALALRHGEELTINPETGLPEAFKLKSLLPMILGAALAPLTAGTSLAFLGATPLASALTVGAGYGLAKGSLKEGLLAGLGAYGGAGLAASLGSAGVSEAAAQEALKRSTVEDAIRMDLQERALYAPVANTATSTATAAPTAAQTASDISGHGYGAPGSEAVAPVTTTTPMTSVASARVPGSPMAPISGEEIARAGFQGAAPPTGLDALSKGAQSIYDKGQVGDFFTNKANRGFTMAAASSALMAPEDEEGMPETKRDPGYIRPARYDWRTGKYQYFDPVKASEWGTRNLSEYTNPNDPNARTPLGAKAGGLMALANGGAVAFADGGETDPNYAEKRLASINAFLQTNPSAEALAAAQDYYKVGGDELERARAYGNVGSAPGSDIANAPTGPVVGGGGYDPRPTVSAGTVEQGYSQAYSPEQVQAIRAGFLDNRDDPQRMMELMNQYGVNVKDIATAMGGSEKGYQNIFLQGGADPSFGGMGDYKATTNDKAYLDNMLKQPNPLGQGTLADVYKKQGIDPYTDPRVLTQAREENERLARRNLMRTNAGADPVPGPVPGPGGGGGGGGGGGTTPGPGPGPGPTIPPVYTPPTGPYNPPPPVPVTRPIAEVTTGGSREGYEYLAGQRDYPVNPYLPIDPATGKRVDVGVPYWKAMGMENPYKGPKVADELTNPNTTPKTAPPTGKKWVWNPTDRKWVAEAVVTPTITSDSVQVANGGVVRRMALGGLGALAGGGAASQYNLGGYSDGGRLLRGPGDGVSDNIPATIGNKQPARLADGEFVVPARIVSELGNGSTEAGARKLYAMMDRVQKARGKTTGKNRVATNSRADKYLPA